MVVVMSLFCESIKYIYPNTDAKHRNSKQWSDLLVADKCLKNQSLILARLLPET
jgi:hypothetical protein